MPTRPPSYRPPQQQPQRPYYRLSSRQRGYTHNWDQARAAYLAENPLCVYCQRKGRLTAAGVVDHIIPHRGDLVLFWDATNWQALCAHCHNSDKRREEWTDRVAGPVPGEG